MARAPKPLRSDADALLAAVWASPHADLPRLVYADYLDENGYPERAEFIRLQVERARLEAAGGEVPDAAVEREQSLFDAHRAEWLAGQPGFAPFLPAGASAEYCVRGFPAPPVNYSATDAAAGRVPPPSACLRLGWAKPGGLAVLLKSKPARDAEELTLAPSRGWTPEDFAALSGPDKPDHVTTLRVGGRFGVGLVEWAGGLSLARLRRLELPRVTAVAALVVAVGNSPAAPQLAELDLLTVRLNATALRLLGEAKRFDRLRSLKLGGGSYTDPGLAAFAASPVGQRLERLAVRGRLWDAAAAPVPNLRCLTLWQEYDIPAEAWRTLAASARHFAGLRELHIGPESVRPETRAALWAAFGERLPPAAAWVGVAEGAAK